MNAIEKEEVRRIRLALGMTQGELAAALGLKHKDTVRDWERGRRPCQGPAAILLTQMGSAKPRSVQASSAK